MTHVYADWICLRKMNYLAGALALFFLEGCGQGLQSSEISAIDSDGLPVTETLETRGPIEKAAPEPTLPLEVAKIPVGQADPSFEGLPPFDASWGLKRSVYDKALDYRRARGTTFANDRYLAMVDMSQHSKNLRFYLFDLNSGEMERHAVSHGAGSDPERSGYATAFSNVPNSRKTSLGVYKTMGTYIGIHGESLRLVGLEDTNNRALARSIVVHGSKYVSNSSGKKSGRSWGCPALDQRVVANVIGRLKGGAMLVIWN